MLTHPTHDRLVALGLTGMAKALEEQRNQPDIAALSFEERLALMVDREAIERENKRLVNRLKFASLRQSAVVEDVDMKSPRGLGNQASLLGDWRLLAVELAVRGTARRLAALKAKQADTLFVTWLNEPGGVEVTGKRQHDAVRQADRKNRKDNDGDDIEVRDARGE